MLVEGLTEEEKGAIDRALGLGRVVDNSTKRDEWIPDELQGRSAPEWWDSTPDVPPSFA